ncbi:MAG: hypothetical protein K8R77_14955 [Anaerolineaceae bacterium]|nr:hypothetical protein [Anaerolineaceae bacterium]
MAYRPLFEGLIFDETDQPVSTAYVGEDPCYVVNDAGFLRHISSEKVDRQILELMTESISGNEDMVVEQTSKMLGKDDLFSRAIIQNQLKNLDKQMETILETGIPEEGRAYMGMMGFRVTINLHGDVIDFNQPGMALPEDGEE